MVYTELKSPEYYLNFAKKYQKSQAEVLNYFQMKKLAEAGMLDDYIKMIETKSEAERRLKEEQQARETRPELRLEPKAEAKPEPKAEAEPKAEPEEYRYVKGLRPSNQGINYTFYKGKKRKLVINLNKKNELESPEKLRRLNELDPVFFGGQENKDLFIKNLKLNLEPTRPRGDFIKKLMKPKAEAEAKAEAKAEAEAEKFMIKVKKKRKQKLKVSKPKPLTIIEEEEPVPETTIGVGYYNDDMNTLNMLVGSRLAGNKNKKMMNEIKKLMKSMVKNKTLTKNQEQMVLKRM